MDAPTSSHKQKPIKVNMSTNTVLIHKQNPWCTTTHDQHSCEISWLCEIPFELCATSENFQSVTNSRPITVKILIWTICKTPAAQQHSLIIIPVKIHGARSNTCSATYNTCLKHMLNQLIVSNLTLVYFRFQLKCNISLQTVKDLQHPSIPGDNCLTSSTLTPETIKKQYHVIV